MKTPRKERKMRKKLLGLAATTLLAFTISGITQATADEQAPVTINLITAPFGTGSYVLGTALEQISKKHHKWLRIVSSESPGFVYNIKKLSSEAGLGKTTIIGSGPVVSRLAKRGEKPFDKKYPAVKLLTNYNLVAVWMATLDPNIKTINDLIGKKIAIGRVPQVNWAVEPKAVIEKGYGISLDKINIQHTGTKGAVAALLDGKVDAAVVGGYLDPQKSKISLSPQTMEFVASGRKIYHLEWSADAVKKTAAQGIPVVPYTLPANSFDGQDTPLPILVDSAAWVASPDLPEKIAYEITKLIIDNITKFGDYAANGKLMSHPAMVFGWAQKDIHPGALRAYKEAGILK